MAHQEQAPLNGEACNAENEGLRATILGLEWKIAKIRQQLSDESRRAEEIHDMYEASKQRLGRLENKNEEIREELRYKTRLGEQVRQELIHKTRLTEQIQRDHEVSQQGLEKLASVIEMLHGILKEEVENASENVATRWNKIEQFTRHLSSLDPGTITLQSSLTQLVTLFSNVIQSLSQGNMELRQMLSNFPRGASGAQARGKKKATREEIGGKILAWQVDRDTYENGAEKQLGGRRHGGVDNNLLKEEHKGSEEAEEEEEEDEEEEMTRNAGLELERTDSQDIVSKLRQQLKSSQERSKHWEANYQDSREASGRLQTQISALEDRVASQQAEMRSYIQDYHAKSQDPKHWETCDMRSEMRRQEKMRDEALERTRKSNLAKARLEEQVADLVATNRAQEQYIAELQRLGIRGTTTTRAPRNKRAERASQAVLSSAWESPPSSPGLGSPKGRGNGDGDGDGRGNGQTGGRMPRCMHPGAVKERAKKTEAFRAAQRRVRHEQAVLDGMVEQARRRAMGRHYPPGKPEWSELVKMEPWERWGVDAWALVWASPEQNRVLKVKEVEGEKARGV